MEDSNVSGNSNQGDKKITVNIGFIGAGNMATAIGEGLLKSGIISPSNIYVSASSLRNLSRWKTLGVNTTINNSDIVSNCPIIILAVKPSQGSQAISSAFAMFSKTSLISVTVVSILAGLTTSSIKNDKEGINNSMDAKGAAPAFAWIDRETPIRAPIQCMFKSFDPEFDIDRVNIVRAMPNTPLLVGEGCTVFSATGPEGSSAVLKNIFEEHKSIIQTIFSVNGFCKEVDESLINSIGALSGSGPAYVYQIIEALSDGVVKLGVPRDLSYTVAAQTLLGAAKMVLTTGKHPGQLKDEVCSPGGTTIAAISAMERNGVRSGLIQAIEAAYQRSEEINKASK